MARVELLTAERAPLLARPYFERGDPGPIAAALASVPELMEPVLAYVGAVLGRTAIDPRLKEIVILRVSAVNGCRYCTETHTRAAARLGFDPGELAALRGEGPMPPGWSAEQHALLRFSEALSERPAEAVQHLRPHFEDWEIVELVTLGSATVMLNRFATALDLPW